MECDVFDYVVAGAGSAGCVVAARLSEDSDVSVALVEAGPWDTAAEIHIPAAFAGLFKTRWDWDFDSESEPGLGGRRVYLPWGRMVRGSSSMNAIVYMRATRPITTDGRPPGRRGGAIGTCCRISCARTTTNGAPTTTTAWAAPCMCRTRARRAGLSRRTSRRHSRPVIRSTRLQRRHSAGSGPTPADPAQRDALVWLRVDTAALVTLFCVTPTDGVGAFEHSPQPEQGT